MATVYRLSQEACIAGHTSSSWLQKCKVVISVLFISSFFLTASLLPEYRHQGATSKISGGQNHFWQRLWRHRCAVNHDTTFLLRSAYQHWRRNLFHSGAMGVRRGENGHFLPLLIGLRTKYARKPEVKSLIPILIELVLSMTVYFPAWLTLHKSQLHCFGITPWWTAYGSLMSAHLPAEAGCETWERIVQLLDFSA